MIYSIKLTHDYHAVAKRLSDNPEPPCSIIASSY